MTSSSEPLYTETPLAGQDADDNSDAESIQENETHDLLESQEPAENDSLLEDPFQPFNDLPTEDRNILTIRALVVGILCGTLINASNIYLGLKSGWTASANIFASIVGFTLLKSCAKYANHIPILAGDFGPRENNIVQTAATAAGGMSSVFVSAFPAMYQLGLLDSPRNDFWRIATLTAAGGYFGFFFATPLRKFFIVYVARELRMVFPSSSATAITIRSMHLAALKAESSAAQAKMKALTWAFSFALLLRVLSQYAIGLLWDWHPWTWIYVFAGHSDMAISLESWGWFIELSPAFIGSGMLVGLNVSISYLFGSVLAWGIVGPILVSQKLAFGIPASEDPQWHGYKSYFSLSDDFTSAAHSSPRYWLLWPGVLCMIVVSFTELACQWRIFWLTSQALWKAVAPFILSRRKTVESRDTISEKDNLIDDPAAPEDCVSLWMWLPGLIIVLVATCLVMRLQYGMPVSETCLALFLAFFFSFLAVQATGATDITPLTAASKASQIILGTATRGQEWDIAKSQRMNLLGGALSSIGASQAADLTGDFRVGFLLHTSPKLQWLAQGLGTAFAVFIAPATFVLFSAAYPCINDANATTCTFHVPSVSAWRAVAVAVTDPAFPIPPSSRTFSVVFATIGMAMVLIRHTLLTGSRLWIRAWWPNVMVMALAFIIPATVYGTAMTIGAVVAALWSRLRPTGFELFGHAVAAGFMAGEGIGGVVNAVLQIVGWSGEVWGSTVGCPAGVC